jgi:hypothetical protein
MDDTGELLSAKAFAVRKIRALIHSGEGLVTIALASARSCGG